MDAVQVVENLLVEGSQFIVQPNDPVKSAFVTFRSMWAAAAILALVKLYGPPILVALYRFCPYEKKFLVVWTNQPSRFIYSEIHGTIRVVTVLLVLGSLFVHGELHVFFHSMLLAVQAIIQIAIAQS